MGCRGRFHATAVAPYVARIMTKYTDFVNYNLSMLTDQVRTDTYRKAILQSVKSGDVVVDLGCGSGVLTFFACQAGARKVFAIESEEVIEMAKQVCRQNGFQDRVVFLNDLSYCVELPERADVLLTETMGTFGLDEGLLGSMIDGRIRFLKERGTLIPQSLELFMVPVELPGFYQHMVDFWASGRYGVDFSPVRRFAANNFHPLKLDEETFLSNPLSLVRIPFSTAVTSDMESEVSFYATRRGRMHGLAGWFAVELLKGICLSNVPGSPTSHWGIAFFPLERPVPLERGNRIRVAVRSMSNGTVWGWRVEINGRQFDQTTLWGFPQPEGELHKLSPECTPKLSRRGEAELFLLGLLNGKTTITQLEDEIFHGYPDLVKTREQAAAFVREVVRKCG